MAKKMEREVQNLFGGRVQFFFIYFFYLLYIFFGQKMFFFEVSKKNCGRVQTFFYFGRQLNKIFGTYLEHLLVFRALLSKSNLEQLLVFKAPRRDYPGVKHLQRVEDQQVQYGTTLSF